MCPTAGRPPSKSVTSDTSDKWQAPMTSDQQKPRFLRSSLVTCHCLKVFRTRKCSRPESLPVCRYLLRSEREFPGGSKDSVDGRTATRQGGSFGSSPDEPAFQPCQLRPLSENDLLKVVFGWSPVLQGKVWPLTENNNFTAFILVCQCRIFDLGCRRSGFGIRGSGFAESRPQFAVFFCQPRNPLSTPPADGSPPGRPRRLRRKSPERQ